MAATPTLKEPAVSAALGTDIRQSRRRRIPGYSETTRNHSSAHSLLCSVNIPITAYRCEGMAPGRQRQLEICPSSMPENSSWIPTLAASVREQCLEPVFWRASGGRAVPYQERFPSAGILFPDRHASGRSRGFSDFDVIYRGIPASSVGISAQPLSPSKPESMLVDPHPRLSHLASPTLARRIQTRNVSRAPDRDPAATNNWYLFCAANTMRTP